MSVFKKAAFFLRAIKQVLSYKLLSNDNMPHLLEFCRKATCHVTCEIPLSKFNEHHSEFTAVFLVLV